MSEELRRLRWLRDAAVRYVYEHGAGMPHFATPADEVARAIGATKKEFSAVTALMFEQGIIPPRVGPVGSVCLSDIGQETAERLGPDVLLRDPPPPASMHISATDSIVQIAGSGSTQTASLTLHKSQIEQILHEIESELPSLQISEDDRTKAKGLVASMRSGLGVIGSAGLTVIGGALGQILINAGSPLGQRLMELINVAAR